jgi:hypothetical protein
MPSLISGGVAFGLFCLVLAIVFSPIGLGANNSCSLFSANQNCALTFNNNATIVLSASGYTLYNNQAYQACSSGGSINGVPQPTLLNWILSLPIVSNIYAFGAWVGATISGNSAVAAACGSQIGNILVFQYTGTSLVLLLIGVIVTSAAIAALTGIAILGSSGTNSAGTYLAFMVSALTLLWLVLSAFALPTFATMPLVIGGTIYTLLTLTYSIGMLDLIAG